MSDKKLVKGLVFEKDQDVSCTICGSELILLATEKWISKVDKEGYTTPISESILQQSLICPTCYTKYRHIDGKFGEVVLGDPRFDNTKHQQEQDYLINHNNKETNGFGYYKEEE